MFEIFHLIRNRPRPVGFAEAAAVYRSRLWLMNPFTRVSLRTSIWGKVGCRGNWHHPEVLTADGYIARRCPHEPWMEIDFTDLLAAHVLCETLEPHLPTNGFSRFRRRKQ